MSFSDVFIVYDAKTFGDEVLAIYHFCAAVIQNIVNEAASGDDGSIASEFFLETVQHAVDHGHETEHKTAAQAVGGVPADGAFRSAKFKISEQSRIADECIHRSPHAGHD